MGRTRLQDGELWINIRPVCRIVCGRDATVVRVTPVSGVEGLGGRNLVDVFRLHRILVDDYGSGIMFEASRSICFVEQPT